MKEQQKLAEEAIKRYRFNLDLALKNCQFLYKMAEQADLLDEQYFIDWLDKLNELSVRH